MNFDNSFYNLFYSILTDDADLNVYKDCFVKHDVHKLGYVNNKKPEEIFLMLSSLNKNNEARVMCEANNFQKNCLRVLENRDKYERVSDNFYKDKQVISSGVIDGYRELGLNVDCLNDVTVFCTAGSLSNAKTDFSNIMLDLTYHDLDLKLKKITTNLLHECFHIIHYKTLCFKAIEGELYTMILDFTYSEGLANFFANYVSNECLCCELQKEDKDAEFDLFFKVLDEFYSETYNKKNRERVKKVLYYNAGPAYLVGEHISKEIFKKYGMKKILETIKKGHLSFFNAYLSTDDKYANKISKYATLPEIRVCL